MEKLFVTIREVAADAGVGTATVSRVLNEPWRVSPSTRDRVLASVQKLGYKPNFRARLLARGSSGNICFLLSNRRFVHSVHAGVLQGAATEAERTGLQVIYAACHYEAGTAPSEIQMPQILAARGLIDGVVAAGTNHPNMLRALDELGVPYVVFGTNLVVGEGPRITNAVYVDDEDGGGQATEHLILLGHKKIRFIGDTSLPWYRRRYLGYARSMARAGLHFEPPSYSAEEGGYKMAFDAVIDLCERKVDFSALFVGDDMAALGAIRALNSRGLSVPGDVSVVGFNDEEIAQITEPPLTTVRVPTEDVGAQCVSMLNDVMKGMIVDEPVVLPVRLVLRNSTSTCTKT